MEITNASDVKLIYTDWFIAHGRKRPFGNGIHPVIREFIQYIYKNNLNIDYYKILQYEQEEKGIKFDHSEFINYVERNYPNNLISLNQVKDDDSFYIYPLEVKGTLAALNEENSFVLNDTTYKWYLRDIIDPQIIEYAKLDKVKILINIIHDPLYDDIKIRLFEKQMNKLGIDGSNIIFIGGTKFDEYYKKHPESNVKIYNGHLFLRGYAEMMCQFPSVGNLGYMCELVEESDLDINKIRPYKVLCNNRTMTKLHRVAAGYFAIKYDLLKEGLFSFIHKISADELFFELRKVISEEKIDKDSIKKLADMLPYELDTAHLLENEKKSFGVTNNKKDWYENTYINIVTETFFGPNVFLSEKVFKPLSNLQPFIVMGDYKTLAELKKLGFKTFSPFIDESYDNEIDNEKRMKLIEIEIKKIKNKSIEEIHEWYYSIVDILLYNQKHLYTFKDYECFEVILQEIKNDYKKMI